MPIPTTPAQAPRKLLRDQVHDRILEAIVTGELEPGKVLLDKELEAWLGASRTPIRESLNRLANAGFVDVLPQKLTRVSAIDPRHFGQILEVLGALDAAAVRETVPLLTAEDAATLKRFRDTVLADEDAPITPKRTQAISDIFQVFLDRYDNKLLLRLPEKFAPHLQRTINASGELLNVPVGFGHLRDLIDRALSGDADGAADAVTAYFGTSLRELSEQLIAADTAAPKGEDN
ncbi:GntR family transcriptional regulator [Plantibacter sp. Mn2098]|uniref:GntR family transcriptional regulator n=1 Tax=Plantibacter sp. Mn2098 TaxID=3395266 RepID=UPI003BEDF6D6